ncbi:MAG: 4Fe-4S binding protein [Rubrivivax sp.]|nr:4Fe-4S binding protein [Rubrivivax sp.]
MKTLICNCNQTLPLDAPALQRALARTPGASTDGLEVTHTLLCRREAAHFQRAAKQTTASGDELLVACTQESRLFLELNQETEGAASVQERPIRFVNIRETAGWSQQGAQATPKIAALLAAAQLPAPDPVATVSYRSQGRCLVIGPAEAAERAAGLLADKLDVSLLLAGPGALAQAHTMAVHGGRLKRLTGWLGQFEAEWESHNPIDLDLCTRCNACIDACPEGAIGMDYQVDLDACRKHRDCVRVCDAAAAIDFSREPLAHRETYDLVLDLRSSPAFSQHQLPQGYLHPGSDERALADAVLRLREMTGEFDKPRFFRYDIKLCAHSRNEKIGCTACIEVCSAHAIRSDGSRKGKTQGQSAGGIVVDAHLCAGCGACSTVCPSGAMAYAYPGTVDQGRRLRTMLTAYGHAGGRDAALLIHSEAAGARLLDELGRAASLNRRDRSLQGLPARVLPVAVWHTASVGLDLWLAALAQGASQVWVLLTDEEAPEYHQALQEQMDVAQALLTGLGYAGRHLRLLTVRDARDLHALDAALRAEPAQTVSRPAHFSAQADKRATLDLAIDHLQAHSPRPVDEIALPAVGSPLGSLQVDSQRCTLCLSCVGACPEAALADNPDQPQLRFTESKCVQCGLCAKTCPENAITLQPRLWLADGGKARRQMRVLAEQEPYRCVKCGKPFGTLRAIENMLSKLSGHSAFQGAAAERLKMCSDCRVIDLYSNPNEVRITDL